MFSIYSVVLTTEFHALQGWMPPLLRNHYSETRFAANGGLGTTPKLDLLPVRPSKDDEEAPDGPSRAGFRRQAGGIGVEGYSLITFLVHSFHRGDLHRSVQAVARDDTARRHLAALVVERVACELRSLSLHDRAHPTLPYALHQCRRGE